MKRNLRNKIICILFCLFGIFCTDCYSSNNTEEKPVLQQKESKINNLLENLAKDELFNSFCKSFHIDSAFIQTDSTYIPDSNNNIVIENIKTIPPHLYLNLSIIEFVSNVYLVEFEIPYENAHLRYILESTNDSLHILGYRIYEI